MQEKHMWLNIYFKWTSQIVFVIINVIIRYFFKKNCTSNKDIFFTTDNQKVRNAF